MVNHFKSNTTIDVSLIVNVHREQKFIARTFRSLADAISHASINDINCEVIIVLDASDAATTKAVSSWKSILLTTVRLVDVNNRSLALSRMSGLKVAEGEYVSLHDADDLVSYNYITEKYKRNRQDPKAIVVPEILHGFGSREWATIYTEADPRLFLDMHPYISQIFCRTEALRSITYLHPRKEMHRAYEDWHANANLISNGYHFCAAPGTTLFYRQHQESIMAQERVGSIKKIIEPTDLFKPENFLKALNDFDTRSKIIGHKEENYDSIKQRLKEKSYRVAVDAMAQIDPQVLPRPRTNLSIDSLIASPKNAGMLYSKLCKLAGEKSSTFPWEHIFILPSLCIGGGEKYLIQISKSLHDTTLVKPLFITTDTEEDNPWLPNISSFSDHIHLSEATESQDRTKNLLALSHVLTRVCENSQKKVFIHVKTAPDGFMVQNACSQYLPSKTFVNYRFLDDPWQNSMRPSIDSMSLKHIEKNIGNSILISDYEALRKKDESYFGFELEDYHTVKAHSETLPTLKQRNTSPTNRLVWVSRYAEQKRVSILPQLVEVLQKYHPKVEIDFYAPGVTAEEIKTIRQRSKNAHFHKPVNKFSEIDVSAYDALLYTSWIDGIPNVVIEAQSLGLPVIAPAVGGIPELIQNKVNGILIDSTHSDAAMCERYSTALDIFYGLDEAMIQELSANAIDAIRRHHNPLSHQEQVNAIFGSTKR